MHEFVLAVTSRYNRGTVNDQRPASVGSQRCALGPVPRLRVTRRRACLSFVAALAATGCSATAPPTPTTIAPISLPTATASPVQGKLLIARNGNFLVFDLGTLRETPLTHFPQ